MSPEFISQKELSYLRFLTNRLIDEEVAGAMLEEIRYLLQPGYKEYLRQGMQVLSIE